MTSLLTGLLVGTAAIVVTVALVSRLQRPAEQRAWAALLVVAAAAYPAFLSFDGVTGHWWIIETAGVVFFCLAAWPGRSGSAWPLVFGWIAHMLWDVLLHGPEVSPFVPGWYVWACALYDFVAAVWIARRLRI